MYEDVGNSPDPPRAKAERQEHLDKGRKGNTNKGKLQNLLKSIS